MEQRISCRIFRLTILLVVAGYAAHAGATPPTITAFSLPETSDNLTVEVSFLATVENGLAGYCLTESNSSSDCVWSSSSPTQYTFQNSGYKLLYAFAKDLADAVSDSAIAYSIIVTSPDEFNIIQALSDGAQSTTIAFSGFAMMTGQLGPQSFFPPGKVADYWGFQYLRDNDPDDMGHNTNFLTRISCNILYLLDDEQIQLLKTLAEVQIDTINLYAWKRYPLMKAFRLFVDNTMPTGATGLNLESVKDASQELYLLDGQISFERAVVYAAIYRSLNETQKAYIDAMVGKGYNSWPDISESDVKEKLQGLSNDIVVAMMTYAGDLYSWYAGSVVSDVYFCPERHGTYFGSFYMKDAPAIGHAGYSIDEQMTATLGNILCDSSLGYISAAGATKMKDVSNTQKHNLYSNPLGNIVLARTMISEALRSLIDFTEPSEAVLSQVEETVDTYSAMYGVLDGENNYYYATTFFQLLNNIGDDYFTNDQKAALDSLRTQYMTVTYEDGTVIDYSDWNIYYLYSAEIPEDSELLISYTSDSATNAFFNFDAGRVVVPTLLLLL
ncbi:hypothetical protein [Desulfovibrio inopinatus]|uniref:hypothetical protein n=1 Tax=Desulfovibrio inopinatus TaxID=102109 RepID=UPI000486C7A4|nr:hypothetical protein [Desulfovibrio inopinatus]